MNYIQITLDILLVIIGLYLAFGKSYFKEKGKNLATKEDIGLITKEIETVKNNIIFSIQRKTEFFKEKKNVALDFNDNVSFFIDYSSKVFDVLANNYNHLDLILKQTEDVRLQGAKVLSSFYKIFVYFDEIPFKESAKKYYNEAVKIQTLTISILFQLEQMAQKDALLMKFVEEGKSQYQEELLELTRNRKELIINHMDERKNLLDNEVYHVRGLFITELSIVVKIKNNSL